MTRFAGLPFVVIDDGTLPADTVPRLLPFATSVAVISPTPTSDLAGQFVEAGVPATVHARGGALLHHAAAHSVRSARHRADPAPPPVETTDAAGDPRSIGHAVELSASDAMTIVVTGPPDDAEDWMRCALRGVSGIVERGQVLVPILVLAHGDLPEGPVVSVGADDASSDYEEILAAGLAQRLERPVELLTRTGDDTAAAPASDPEAPAERLAHDAGVAWVRREVEDPVGEVIGRRERIGAVVTSVVDVAAGHALEPHREVPAEAVASGSPRDAIELLRDAPHDVIVVFDGVRLLTGAQEGRFIAAGVGEALDEATEADPPDPPGDDAELVPAGAGGIRIVGPAIPKGAVIPDVVIVGVRVPSPMAATIADPAHVVLEEPTFAVPTTTPDAARGAKSADADADAPDILARVARSVATIGAALTSAGTGRHRGERRDAAASVD